VEYFVSSFVHLFACTMRTRGLSSALHEDLVYRLWKGAGGVMCREGECCIRLGWDAHNKLNLTSLQRVEDNLQK
jgi:hypothetical protein